MNLGTFTISHEVQVFFVAEPGGIGDKQAFDKLIKEKCNLP